MLPLPPRSTLTGTLFPYTTLFRSLATGQAVTADQGAEHGHAESVLGIDRLHGYTPCWCGVCSTARFARLGQWPNSVGCEIRPIRAVQPPFRSRASRDDHHPVQPGHGVGQRHSSPTGLPELGKLAGAAEFAQATAQVEDRKSTRLNSSH